MIEITIEVIDSFLKDVKRPYINRDVDFYDLELEYFCDLNFILKNIDVQTKRPKFKISKNNIYKK